MKGYDGFLKLFQEACFDHQTLQSHLKTRTNRCQFSVGTPALFLSSNLVTWLLLQLHQCSRIIVLCNSFLCTEPYIFSFLPPLLFLFYWSAENPVLYIYTLYINTCSLFRRIGIKCDNQRIMGEQLLQLICFMLWYVSLMKTNTFSYRKYITEHFLVMNQILENSDEA